MRVVAYILAADPAWCQQSLLSYYDIVDEVYVSYDVQGLGWSGMPTKCAEALDRLLAIDRDNKLRMVPGSFHGPYGNPIEGDTYQRQTIVDHIGSRADWIIQLDSDEILPNAGRLLQALKDAGDEIMAVDWPLRVIFSKHTDGRFLEVRRTTGEYAPEHVPIAVRPGIVFSESRRTTQPTLRHTIQHHIFRKIRYRSWKWSEVTFIKPEDAVVHLSWVRTLDQIVSKVQSWGHSIDFDTLDYVEKVWLRSPLAWRKLKNFHPIVPNTWPCLKPVRLNIHGEP